MYWWEKNNLRLLQNNIRMEEASLDREELLGHLKSFYANALLLNTGGLVSFYPTDLPYQMRSPYLNGEDLTGDMVELCHEHDIKFIARFDFSKLPKSIIEAHPDWAYVSVAGDMIDYNGMVHTCISSEYQSTLAIEILRDVINRYPIDGVFFNMFGFITRDYSSTYHGICQCENCKDAFYKRFERNLPTKEEEEDENYQFYKRFKKEVIDQRLKDIYDFVKSMNPAIAVCNYAETYVDVVMNESNTEIHRPYPVWEYSASENTMKVEGSYTDKTSGNIIINAVGLDYRFQGVSPNEIAIRGFQSLSAGGQLLFCIIGTWETYPDKKNFPTVRSLFKFHKMNEKYFGNFEVEAQITLICPTDDSPASALAEFRGLFRILKEEHLQFKVVSQNSFFVESVADSEVIIVPDIKPSDHLIQQFENARGHIVWVGTTWVTTARKKFLSFFGLKPPTEVFDGRWAYVKTSEKGCFEKTSLAFLDNNLVSLEAENARVEAEIISAGRFGPPELCGGNNHSGKFLIAHANDFPSTILAFHPGNLYLRYGFEEHKNIFLEQVVRNLTKLKLVTNAPHNVEVTLNRYPDTSCFNLCLTNLTGYNGTAFHAPNSLEDIFIRIPSHAKQHTVKNLYKKGNYHWTTKDDELVIIVEKLFDFAMFIICEE